MLLNRLFTVTMFKDLYMPYFSHFFTEVSFWHLLISSLTFNVTYLGYLWMKTVQGLKRVLKK